MISTGLVLYDEKGKYIIFNRRVRKLNLKELDIGTKVAYAQSACNLLLTAIQDIAKPGTHPRHRLSFERQLLPHTVASLEYWAPLLESRSVPWDVFAGLCERYGRWFEASQFYELALERDCHTPRSKFEIRLRLASVYEQIQVRDNKADLNRKAIEYESSEEHGRPPSFLWMQYLQQQTSMSIVREKWVEAAKSCQSLLSSQEEDLGLCHPDTLASLQTLASCMIYEGLHETAEPIIRRLLMSYEDTLGKDHPLTIETVENMASVCQQLGALAEAKELYNRALDAKQRRLGNEHPDVSRSKARLAVVHDLQGEYSQSDELYMQAIVSLRDLLGDEHRDVLEITENRGLSLRLRRKFDQAQAEYKGVLERKQRRTDLYTENEVQQTALQLYAAQREDPECSRENADIVAKKHNLTSFEDAGFHL